MVTVLGTSMVLFALIYAEKKGWVDKEKVRVVMQVGMNAGILGSLLYFLYTLSAFLPFL
ncbi:hypothetical protein HPB58_09650 [Priestia filamentosa]|uniref:hypothetical protein n=1 Tax=Priestia filamentosa TaxID=1402861 RepID=UPI000A086FE1|nr:hypothetical protein [Priestia filamentosa]MDT3765804.1 hypothetical protein [Priestia filamentosa]UOE62417.1 hypothetical protein HPB58_09650 [Priestia filamentosa]SMF69768.1 hypothetical protein SAMN06296056_11138 [Priestia filamentosa]